MRSSFVDRQVYMLSYRANSLRQRSSDPQGTRRRRATNEGVGGTRG